MSKEGEENKARVDMLNSLIKTLKALDPEKAHNIDGLLNKAFEQMLKRAVPIANLMLQDLAEVKEQGTASLAAAMATATRALADGMPKKVFLEMCADMYDLAEKSTREVKLDKKK